MLNRLTDRQLLGSFLEPKFQLKPNEDCSCMNEERSSVKIVIVWLGAAGERR